MASFMWAYFASAENKVQENATAPMTIHPNFNKPLTQTTFFEL